MSNALEVAKMREIAEQLFVAQIYSAYGDRGTESLRFILNFLLECYVRFEPADFNGTLYVLTSDDSSEILKRHDKVELLTARDRWPTTAEGSIAFVLSDGGRVWLIRDVVIDETCDSRTRPIYRYTMGQDAFIV